MPAVFEDLIWRGLVHQATDRETLARRLDTEQMVAYIGFDPTAGSLHVGHLQQLCLLRRLYSAGHQVIALVGGGTGMIGDPSGKSEERNLLSTDQLDANRQGIRRQIESFLQGTGDDLPSGAAGDATVAGHTGGVNVADNADWLATAPLLEFLRDVGKHFSVNEMIRKDSVRTRLEGREQSLSFTEFSYMLLQAWDFVHLYDRYGCDLQMGGSDQWGNITEGADLIRRLRGAAAYGLTSPLVTKSDGSKFGKTESGAVWLDPERTSPYAFYQFWLRTGDADAVSYLKRFTMLDHARIEALAAATAGHPERRESQKVLAAEMTAMVHGRLEAERAETASGVLFTEGIADLDAETLERALRDAPSTVVDTATLDGMDLVDALVLTGLAASRSEARRHLTSGAIYLNGLRAAEGRTISTTDALHGKWVVVRRGKANQHVLVVH